MAFNLFLAKRMKTPYVLILAYDGTSYFGWQKTKMGPSIQETLERAVAQVSQEQVEAEAASRTDRGVHAEGQVVKVLLSKDWEPRRLQKAINAHLPADIRVVRAEKILPTFHPTLQAKQKEYHYRLCLGAVQEPQWRQWSWHFPDPIALDLMEAAAPVLLGTHDFRAFANEAEKNPICTLSTLAFVPLERKRLQIVLRGDRFLYKMARNLVGTLLYVGCGKLPVESVKTILKSQDRRQAGITAPAHGLFIHRVDY